MEALPLIGAPGSPYTRKMVAVLRYRRIPYRYIYNGREPADWPKSKVRLLPTFFLNDADGALQAVTDSTPLIRRFEGDYDGRSIRPPSPSGTRTRTGASTPTSWRPRAPRRPRAHPRKP